MLNSVDDFLRLANQNLNPAQRQAVEYSNGKALQIVAGPGSGKTTVLVLRALRMVFVDGILPENILLTTFTRKAARELRSRWLDQGEKLWRSLPSEDIKQKIDLNRCRIGTLDSLVHDALVECKPPGQAPPNSIDNATSNLVLRRGAFSSIYYRNKDSIDSLLARYPSAGGPPRNQGASIKAAKILIHRLVQDRVDLDSYRKAGEGERLIVEMLELYRRRSHETNSFDFALLEELFLHRLNVGTLSPWTLEIKALLVDEYQDTNPLQEAIYFGIINAARPAVTIVGDDDQALYRFRGGSVELFTRFSERCFAFTGKKTQRIDVVKNYRSTPEIVNFYNEHISSDLGFASARINPPKDPVVSTQIHRGVKVVGIFAGDQESLASKLSQVILKLLSKKPVALGESGVSVEMTALGKPGDIAFLRHSIKEFRYSWGKVTERFPSILRKSMEASGLRIYNPRGRSIREVPVMQEMLGLLLLMADPDQDMVDNYHDSEVDGENLPRVQPTKEARIYLDQWRAKAQFFVDADPEPNDRGGLRTFLDEWQKASRGEEMGDEWPEEWPILEVVYKLITWMPSLQDDAEQQVWLQALMGTIDSASTVSPYGMKFLNNTRCLSQSEHVRRSRTSLIRDALLPIAEDSIDIDEDLVASIPLDQIQFMTIHQAKGLEFPIVIVDVGSEFKSNHASQHFQRFPQDPSPVVQLEQDVEDHLPSELRKGRALIDRTFDDLVRLYYVAYSRPQSLLILVGHENCLNYGKGEGLIKKAIPHMALGWHRDRTWPWRQEFNGKTPPLWIDGPFARI